MRHSHSRYKVPNPNASQIAPIQTQKENTADPEVLEMARMRGIDLNGVHRMRNNIANCVSQLPKSGLLA